MKVLYYIHHLNTTGADRWIYEGWRDAFKDLGHEFKELTIYDNMRRLALDFKPDILFIANHANVLVNHLDDLKWIRKLGTKVFFIAHWPMLEKEINAIKNNEDIVDIYFGEREPESMHDFTRNTGKTYHLIPNAANRLVHFPVQPVTKYQYDIVYLGAKLPKKKWFFDNVLIPLTKKYKVGIFGPYWTLRDNLLRLCQKISKSTRLRSASDYLGKMRVYIPGEEENQLYSSAKICLNYHERELDGSQPHCIENQRTFKIPACGGFQICDETPFITRYFSKDEIVTASPTDSNDWFRKIDYYLKNPNERKKIQSNATARALKSHTYHNRVEHVIHLAKSDILI